VLGIAICSMEMTGEVPISFFRVRARRLPPDSAPMPSVHAHRRAAQRRRPVDQSRAIAGPPPSSIVKPSRPLSATSFGSAGLDRNLRGLQACSPLACRSPVVMTLQSYLSPPLVGTCAARFESGARARRLRVSIFDSSGGPALRFGSTDTLHPHRAAIREAALVFS